VGGEIKYTQQIEVEFVTSKRSLWSQLSRRLQSILRNGPVWYWYRRCPWEDSTV